MNDLKKILSPSNQDPSANSQIPTPIYQKRQLILLGVFFVLVITIIGLVGYILWPQFMEQNITTTIKNKIESIHTPADVFASEFAVYEEVLVNINPSIVDYEVNDNLANVINSDQFTFSEEAKRLLVENNFVVIPSYYDEFFSLYEKNRYAYAPSFITTDSILHNYHLMFDHLLKKLEEEKLTNELKNLNQKMLLESLSQFDQLKNTKWENAAKRNVGFFAVGSRLLDSSVEIPSIVKDEVNQELGLIEEHQGLAVSPLMNINTEEDDLFLEDYSQYVPRGHYNTDKLKSYFKSMMWYGRLTFRMKNEDEVKSALLITLALTKDDNQSNWNTIYEPVNFFVGKSDDITYYQFRDLLKQVYGDNISLDSLSINDDKLISFINATKVLTPPQINSMPIFEASVQGDREDEIKGFRFMGQRFTIDASIFQRLIYREVGDKTKSCENFDPRESSCLSGARCLPKGLDIPATIGSIEAKDILKDLGEDEYACYSENMSKMNNYLSSLNTKTWTQNLYWGWLYQLLPLLDIKTEGYPSFMRNSAWAKKELNTFLGSWTELKHDTILYAKQVYAELGGGMPEEEDDRGYVEPNPHVYARLASLLKMTGEGLDVRGLLDQTMKDNLLKMEQLALSLKVISEKELNNKKLTNEEYELIRSYGGQLEHFWLEVNKDEPKFKESSSPRDYLNENPAAIVADVATDPNGSVLEEGTGKIFEIYVIVPIDGKLKITKGGVYSYYEFTWPLSDRLTDQKWREMLRSDTPPDLPDWTKSFISL